MQELTLEDRYRNLADENRDRMEDTIRMARECEDIGDQTLARLALDREKLMKVDQDLDFINDSLKRAEYHLHSMESWSGAIGNYFRGKPRTEQSGTLANVQRKKPEVKAPPCPPSVWRGKEIADRKIRSEIEKRKLHDFVEGEYLMYVCSNASRLASVQKIAADCVVITNLGAFQVVNGKRVGGPTDGFMLRSVESAELVKGSLMNHDRVVVRTWGGRKAELTFWNRKSSEFMTALMNQIPSRSREWKSSIPASRGRSGTGGYSTRRTTKASQDIPDGETTIQKLAREHDTEFDSQLDDLSSVLDNVAFKAKSLGDELSAQNELTSHIRKRVDNTHVRMKASDARSRALL